jgi:hypothetical protein
MPYHTHIGLSRWQRDKSGEPLSLDPLSTAGEHYLKNTEPVNMSDLGSGPNPGFLSAESALYG